MQDSIYAKSIFIAALTIFVMAVLGLGLTMWLEGNQVPTSTTNSGSTSTVSTNSNTSTGSSGSTQATNSGNNSGGYSASTVSSHNSASSCWLSISGKVYDVTAYLSQRHPGGNVITAYCGSDATNVFDSYHNQMGYNVLNSYLIGNLN